MTPPRFASVACSSCGETFGPGDAGFSTCAGHAGRAPVPVPVELRELRAREAYRVHCNTCPFCRVAWKGDPQTDPRCYEGKLLAAAIHA